MSHPIELVIFDCDGVLVDSERIAVRLDAVVLATLGWHLTEAEIVDRFMGRSSQSMTKEIEAHLGRSLPADWEEEFRPLYRRIFSATEVEHGKPAPDLFLHAAQQMGIAPEACAVVEDSRYGLQAARAAGMRALAYAGGMTPAHRLEGPDTVIFDDMRKLPGLLGAAASP
ncbi:HAD family hydrolase [Streptomyces sp. DSM 116496]|uniref:HAD family hydrolase n=1 Tax=Streptomyces stoeckheimensis TaxID=3344656 RepID=UPI0038B38F7F